VKNFPTVIASASRDVAIEVLRFDGADRITNRDAIGFYFDIRLEPGGEPSRLAVVFSGTVMAVKPEAFGLKSFGDREANFIAFAEAAIGDALDDSGLPEFTPSGTSAAKIDCFSPHFQAWRDRRPVSDDGIEAYLFTHVVKAWKYGHPSWTLGPSDLLRLNQPLPTVLRMVRLFEGDAWNVSEETDSRVTITPVGSFLRERVATKVLRPAPELTSEPASRDVFPAAFVYVDEARIAELRRLEPPDLDLRKLISLCEELNQCYRAQCYHAVAALTRAVVDHVPPIFGLRTFSEVANNYGGTKSFKECVRRLEDAARKIADAHLHTPVRNSEVLPTRVQVNFSNELDVLLGEIIRLL
jgi:hypothetical protein